MRLKVRVASRGVSLLLEVMMGLGLFATCLLLLFAIFPISQRSMALAKNESLAILLAQSQIARIEQMDFNDPDFLNPDGVHGPQAGLYPPNVATPVSYPFQIHGVSTLTDFTTTWTVTTLTQAQGYPTGRVKDVVVHIVWYDGDNRGTAGSNAMKHEVTMETYVSAH